MKRTHSLPCPRTSALMTVCSALLLVAPTLADTPGKGTVAYNLEDLRMLGINEASAILQFLKESPFKNPDKWDSLVAQGAALQRPLREHDKWEYAEGVPMADRSVMRWTDDALKYLDDNVRSKVAGVLIQTATMKTPELFSKFEKVEKWVTNQDFPEKFKRLDERWAATMDWVGKNRGKWRPEIEYRNVLETTKLEGYSKEDGRTIAWFDRLVRTLDNYLLSVSNYELEQAESRLNTVAAVREDAKAAVKLFRETYESTNGYKHTKRLVDYYTKIFEASEEAEQDIREKIAEFKDSSTPVGKLRACKDLGATVLVDTTPVSNGCPIYTRRVRIALKQAKDLFDTWKRENALNR